MALINESLQDAAWRPNGGSHVILLFTDDDDYYQYVSYFYCDGIHPTSGIHEPAGIRKELAKDVSWLSQARGKVVKIVAQLIPLLPPGEHYQVIFMDRELSEVIASQKAMLVRKKRRGAELEESRLMTTYSEQLRRVQHQLSRRTEFRSLVVNYGELLAQPLAGAKRVAEFLGEPFDLEAAAKSVRPELRRQNVG